MFNSPGCSHGGSLMEIYIQFIQLLVIYNTVLDERKIIHVITRYVVKITKGNYKNVTESEVSF